MSIFQENFGRNVITLVTGTAFAQAIVFAATPILTRIYTPDDYGVFAVYMAVVSILAALSSGRYELATMLPVKDKDAINILALSVLLSTTMSIILFVIVIIFNKEIATYLGNEKISTWLYLMPISVFCMGMYQSFNYWNNRKKQYLKISQSKVMQSSSTVTSNIYLGLEKSFSAGGGLITGGLVGQAIATVFLGLTIAKKDSTLLNDINRKKILILGKKYKKFPIYDLPAYTAFTMYSNMAVIFFNKFFNPSVAGFYFLANRLMQAPITLFSKSFSDVFYQKLSQRPSNEIISKELNYYSLKIAKLSMAPFLIIVYTSSLYVEFIFGQEWKDLYKYIVIFSIPSFFKLWLSPYGHILKTINRQEISMYSHMLRLVLMAGYLASYFYIEYEILWFLFIYAILESSIHILMVWFVDKVVSNQELYKVSVYRISALSILGLVNFQIIFGV